MEHNLNQLALAKGSLSLTRPFRLDFLVVLRLVLYTLDMVPLKSHFEPRSELVLYIVPDRSSQSSSLPLISTFFAST